MHTEPVIRVQGLVKKYGDFNAVDGIDFAVQEREIFGSLALHLTGRAIREQEGTELDRMRRATRVWAGRR